MNDQFKHDVDYGLSQAKKSISSKYFYDHIGDELFIQIMAMKEYYLTDCEHEVFTVQHQDIIEALAPVTSEYFELIELGAGDGIKTQILLKALQEGGHHFSYLPIDISSNILVKLHANLHQVLPLVDIRPQQGDYFDILKSLKNSHHPKVVLFLGSNLGNLTDQQASEFLQQLGANLCPGDKLLLGLDLVKPSQTVLPAYNDAHGITRAFNLNLLKRINRELGGNFNLDQFEHCPEYDEQQGIATSYLKSRCQQEVFLHATGKHYRFTEGEKIFTEISRKYSDSILSRILQSTHFKIGAKFTDSRHYFTNYLLTRTEKGLLEP